MNNDIIDFDLGGLSEDSEETGHYTREEIDKAVAEVAMTIDNKVKEMEDWAAKQISAKADWVVFDIETGALPWEEIESQFESPAPPAAFDESAVKYGNTKDPAKRAEKLASAQEAWELEVSNYAAKCEASKAEFIDNAAKSPLTGSVVAIGISVNGNPVRIVSADFNGEKFMLESFWHEVSAWLANRVIICGHNSNFFDWPFLLRRSWKLDISIPPDVMNGRYLNPLLKDTMVAWGCGAREFVGLDTLARFFNVGHKPNDCKGAQFARMWLAGGEEKEIARKYLENDVLMTAEVAKKLGII